jgi:hemerythrin-like domain-containing protein
VTRISDFLAGDHRRCDALFESAIRAGAAGDWERARGELEAFARALRLHMAAEEKVLFPAFERATGTDDGPTRVMRFEHRRMLALLEDVRAALEARDPERMREAARPFAELLASHSAKEENVLYPLCDEALPEMSGESLWEQASRA